MLLVDFLNCTAGLYISLAGVSTLFWGLKTGAFRAISKMKA